MNGASVLEVAHQINIQILERSLRFVDGVEVEHRLRKKALLQVAEAVQGFRILQAEGETDAADWLREAELLTDQLLADDKNA